jgi:hypothetical protein
LKERNYFGDLGIDGSILLKWTLKKLFYNVGWIQVAHFRVHKRTLVNTGMELRIT